MIELESDPAGQQRHDQLVQRDALFRCNGNELGVKVTRCTNKDAATGVHGADDSAFAIDSNASAGNIIGMSTDLTPTAAAALLKIVDEHGATLHPSTASALCTRGLARRPIWNQKNYCRPTMAGQVAARRIRKAAS